MRSSPGTAIRPKVIAGILPGLLFGFFYGLAQTAQTSALAQRFRQANRNSDGRLSREDYPQPGIFEAVEANRDGLQSQEEVAAYYARCRAAGRARPATPQSTPPF